MGKSIFFRVVLVLVIIAAIAGLGAFAFRAGLVQGAAQTALVEGAKEGGRLPYMMPYGMHYGYGPGFGFHHFGGFGLFGFLAPLFFFLILIMAIRGLFWGRHHGWRHMGYGPWGMHRGEWDKDMEVPPVVEEWHRRMHEKPSTPPEEQK